MQKLIGTLYTYIVKIIVLFQQSEKLSYPLYITLTGILNYSYNTQPSRLLTRYITVCGYEAMLSWVSLNYIFP